MWSAWKSAALITACSHHNEVQGRDAVWRSAWQKILFLFCLLICNFLRLKMFSSPAALKMSALDHGTYVQPLENGADKLLKRPWDERWTASGCLKRLPSDYLKWGDISNDAWLYKLCAHMICLKVWPYTKRDSSPPNQNYILCLHMSNITKRTSQQCLLFNSFHKTWPELLRIIRRPWCNHI